MLKPGNLGAFVDVQLISGLVILLLFRLALDCFVATGASSRVTCGQDLLEVLEQLYENIPLLTKFQQLLEELLIYHLKLEPKVIHHDLDLEQVVLLPGPEQPVPRLISSPSIVLPLLGLGQGRHFSNLIKVPMKEMKQVRLQLHLVIGIKGLNIEHQPFLLFFRILSLGTRLLKLTERTLLYLPRHLQIVISLLGPFELLSDCLLVFAEPGHVFVEEVLFNLKVRYDEVTEVSLCALWRCDTFFQEIVARVLYFEELSVEHGLLFEFLLYFLADSLVVQCIEQEAKILDSPLFGPIPQLQINLLNPQPHLLGCIYLLLNFLHFDSGQVPAFKPKQLSSLVFYSDELSEGQQVGNLPCGRFLVQLVTVLIGDYVSGKKVVLRVKGFGRRQRREDGGELEELEEGRVDCLWQDDRVEGPNLQPIGGRLFIEDKAILLNPSLSHNQQPAPTNIAHNRPIQLYINLCRIHHIPILTNCKHFQPHIHQKEPPRVTIKPNLLLELLFYRVDFTGR